MLVFTRSPFLVVFIFLSSLFAAGQAATHSDCTPSFPLLAPWLGADDAYSIPLQDGRVVWIFGDTLYGEKRVVEGDAPQMVRNSIGVSTCARGRWNIDYTIRHNGERKLLDFFQEHYAGTWYWAMDGDEHDNQLWVTLLCVRNAPKATSAALGFEICGTDLANVTNLNADPNGWTVSYYPLVPETLHANPSASALVYGEHLYIFTLFEEGNRPAILTRIPLAGLNFPAKNLQYLGADDQWHPGLEPAQARVVMQHGAAEMSVR